MKAASSPLNTILKAILPCESTEVDMKTTTELNSGIEKQAIRTEILAYVSKLRPFLNDDWKSRYQKIWEELLSLDIIDSSVYVIGRQKDTNFNRNLVANIIHFLDSQKAYKNDYSASAMAIALEGTAEHSVRGALGKDPSAAITSRLKRYFE